MSKITCTSILKKVICNKFFSCKLGSDLENTKFCFHRIITLPEGFNKTKNGKWYAFQDYQEQPENVQEQPKNY